MASWRQRHERAFEMARLAWRGGEVDRIGRHSRVGHLEAGLSGAVSQEALQVPGHDTAMVGARKERAAGREAAERQRRELLVIARGAEGGAGCGGEARRIEDDEVEALPPARGALE